ncbi:hypothetical protein JR316_0007981 [Psilocybe cubensis]|uniref:Uncharacterized protein n=1 Tax=Psilocybe cubensis TaxID=181762 RepID=A0ACB8GUT4_PSICU|nr:hypothetical protein JR316_0007981 [Psilocybe cubensis]KAH9479391.1 hypothetical protein JR316_0007981 [Psilocybe cubensis]
MAIGDAVGLKLKLAEGPKYVLRDFPEGYRLFDHNKGPHKAPRHDLYLFGPVKKRFRSVNEFIPHAIWLMGDGSDDCECKYCGKVKKPQREITASMSNILRTTPSMSPSPKSHRIYTHRDKGKGKEKESTTRRIPPRPRDTKVYAAVQQTVTPIKPSSGILQQPMLVERVNDLRAMNATTSMELRRWFRDGEVIWCALPRPILAPDGSNNGSIEFWPGVIEEIRVKSTPIPRDVSASSVNHNVDSDSRTPQPSSSSMQIDPSAEGDQVGTILPNTDEPLPWTVRQYTRYKVQLLGISHSLTIDDSQALPYQAYIPPDQLIHNLTILPVEKLNFERESLLKFNPCPPNGMTPPFFEAVSAYATALQIASIISSTWCLTDDFTVRYNLPPTPKSSSKHMPPPPLPSQSASAPPLQSSSSQITPSMTLAAAIQEAGRRNAQSSSTPLYKGVSTIDSSLPAEQSQKIIERVMGLPPPPSHIVQTRFQGLWWGTERIWANDFIRLKVPRRTMGPKGGPNILPASGPGKRSIEQWQALGKDISELGAGTRGVFLRLDGLVTVDVITERGVIKKEARICGMLYELADIDWDDPEEVASAEKAGPNSSQDQQNPPAGISESVSGNGSTAPPSNPPPLSAPAQGKELPQPPMGYRFRPIITPGHEFVGSMALISGRYYPRILSHPKMTSRINTVLSRSVEEGGVSGFDNLWALEGLSAGYYNSVDPQRYKKSRVAMMQDADKQALEELQAYVQLKKAEAKKDEDAMERFRDKEHDHHLDWSQLVRLTCQGHPAPLSSRGTVGVLP